MSKQYYLRGASGDFIPCMTCNARLIGTDVGNDRIDLSSTCGCKYTTVNSYTRTWLEDVANIELVPIKGQGFNPFKKWKAKVRK